MHIDAINLGPMDNCTYLVSEGSDALLIDFFPHGHFDHVKFAQQLLENHHLKAYIEKNDVILCGIDPHMLNAYTGAQQLHIGPFEVEIIPTPGHTAGGVCIKIGNAVFTGDTLFPGACGRVDLPSSNPRDMRKSLLKLSELPEDTQIFAGHSYGGKCSSTIGYERLKNPFMRNAIRDKEML